MKGRKLTKHGSGSFNTVSFLSHIGIKKQQSKAYKHREVADLGNCLQVGSMNMDDEDPNKKKHQLKRKLTR